VHHSRARTASGMMRSVTVLMAWVLAVNITLDNYQRVVVGRVGKRCFCGCDVDGAGEDALDSIFQTATFARRNRGCGRRLCGGRWNGSGWNGNRWNGNRWNGNRRNVGINIAADNDHR